MQRYPSTECPSEILRADEQGMPRRRNHLCVRSQESALVVLGHDVYGHYHQNKFELEGLVVERQCGMRGGRGDEVACSRSTTWESTDALAFRDLPRSTRALRAEASRCCSRCQLLCEVSNVGGGRLLRRAALAFGGGGGRRLCSKFGSFRSLSRCASAASAFLQARWAVDIKSR